MKPVTDPELLKALEGSDARPSVGTEVTDAKLLAELDRPDPTGSFAENLAAGAGKAVTDIGRGAMQRVREFLTPSADVFFPSDKKPANLADFMNLPTTADVEEARRMDAPLMRTKGGLLGAFAGGMATFMPTMLLPGANTASGAGIAGGVIGALQPTGEGESVASNTAIGTALGTAGHVVGSKLAEFAANKVNTKGASLKTLQRQNSAKDATVAVSREAGYVVPPTQANPSSSWNQLLEGLAGKVKTGHAASVKNQAVTDRLARQALGLSEDVPLTKEALRDVRATAGEAYRNITNVGKYTTDTQFTDDLAKLAKSQQALANEVPELADQGVLSIVKSLDKPEFSGSTIIEVTKALREKATAAFKANESEAGRFYRGAAEAVEDLIERNLAKTGQQSILTSFRDARTMIAKAHTIEAALNDATGHVVAGKLASQLGKGKPLSGELETAARFATAFPKAAQEVERTGAALSTSPLDWATFGGLSIMASEPTILAGVAARPALRSMMLSKPYQRAMASSQYNLGMLMRLSAPTASAASRTLPVAAPEAYFTSP